MHVTSDYPLCCARCPAISNETRQRRASRPNLYFAYDEQQGCPGKLQLAFLGQRTPAELIMSEESSIHFYLNWANERIDEMDAALASLEANTTQIEASSREAAHRLIADL